MQQSVVLAVMVSFQLTTATAVTVVMVAMRVIVIMSTLHSVDTTTTNRDLTVVLAILALLEGLAV